MEIVQHRFPLIPVPFCWPASLVRGAHHPTEPTEPPLHPAPPASAPTPGLPGKGEPDTASPPAIWGAFHGMNFFFQVDPNFQVSTQKQCQIHGGDCKAELLICDLTLFCDSCIAHIHAHTHTHTHHPFLRSDGQNDTAPDGSPSAPLHFRLVALPDPSSEPMEHKQIISRTGSRKDKLGRSNCMTTPKENDFCVTHSYELSMLTQSGFLSREDDGMLWFVCTHPYIHTHNRTHTHTYTHTHECTHTPCRLYKFV